MKNSSTMKTITTILFTTVLFLIGFNVNAQDKRDDFKRTTFGVKAGLNISNIASAEDKQFDNTKAKTGFHAGVTLDIAITKQWFILTGLEYSLKGVEIETGANYHNWDISAAYLQLPLCAGFKYDVSKAVTLVFNVGPYFAYGLHGKVKAGNYEVDTFSDQWVKKFDCGVNFGAGIEWQKFCFTIGGDLGLVNVMQEGNSKSENRNMVISVGYKF